MYYRSGWSPPPWSIPRGVHDRLDNFASAIKAVFREKHGRSNLLPHQRATLKELQHRPDLLVVQCDKNLGPAVIDYPTYVKKAFEDHLSDTSTYQFMTPSRAVNFAHDLKIKIQIWIEEHKSVLTKIERRFLRNTLKENVDPFPVFYLTMKVHKRHWKTRPIVSCSGCLTHPLGIWVDRKLQEVAKIQPSFFKSSKELKDKLLALGELPPNARLFTADAVSMYTNIKTTQAMH